MRYVYIYLCVSSGHLYIYLRLSMGHIWVWDPCFMRYVYIYLCVIILCMGMGPVADEVYTFVQV